jgi:hypothetical protein
VDADQPFIALSGKRMIIPQLIIIIAGLFVLPLHRILVGRGQRSTGRICRDTGQSYQEEQYQQPEKMTATLKIIRRPNDKVHTDKNKQSV